MQDVITSHDSVAHLPEVNKTNDAPLHQEASALLGQSHAHEDSKAASDMLVTKGHLPSFALNLDGGKGGSGSGGSDSGSNGGGGGSDGGGKSAGGGNNSAFDGSIAAGGKHGLDTTDQLGPNSRKNNSLGDAGGAPASDAAPPTGSDAGGKGGGSNHSDSKHGSGDSGHGGESRPKGTDDGGSSAPGGESHPQNGGNSGDGRTAPPRVAVPYNQPASPHPDDRQFSI